MSITEGGQRSAMCVSTWTWLWWAVGCPGLSLASPSPDSFLLPRRSSSPTAWMKASRRDWVTLGGLGAPWLLPGKAGVAVPWPGVPQETRLPTLVTGGFPFGPGREQAPSLETGMGVGRDCARQDPGHLGPSPAYWPLAPGSWAGQPPPDLSFPICKMGLEALLQAF